jgi:hypothetical protein
MVTAEYSSTLQVLINLVSALKLIVPRISAIASLRRVGNLSTVAPSSFNAVTCIYVLVYKFAHGISKIMADLKLFPRVL